MAIFNSYVKLPEGKINDLSKRLQALQEHLGTGPLPHVAR